VGEALAHREALALTTQRGATFLDGADPLRRVQPEVAIGDPAGGLLQRRLGLGDEVLQSSYPSGASLSWASSNSCFVN
jgi:hypothetical protein